MVQLMHYSKHQYHNASQHKAQLSQRTSLNAPHYDDDDDDDDDKP